MIWWWSFRLHFWPSCFPDFWILWQALPENPLCKVWQAQDAVVNKSTHVSDVLEAVQEAVIVTEEEWTLTLTMLTAAVWTEKVQPKTEFLNPGCVTRWFSSSHCTLPSLFPDSGREWGPPKVYCMQVWMPLEAGGQLRELPVPSPPQFLTGGVGGWPSSASIQAFGFQAKTSTFLTERGIHKQDSSLSLVICSSFLSWWPMWDCLLILSVEIDRLCSAFSSINRFFSPYTKGTKEVIHN